MIRFGLRIFVLTVAAAFISMAAAAQPPGVDNNRPSVYDVRQYTIDVRFDRPNKKVIGRTTIEFSPLKDNITQVEFDAVDIAFSSVTLQPSARPLQFNLAADKIAVTLDRPYNAGEVVTLRFEHSSVPKKGVYFVEPNIVNGQTVHDAQIWTQGEPDEARHWFPSFDFPSDKAVTNQFITAESGESVIGNGKLIEVKDNHDGTVTHHFEMDVPHSTYLISFVIGKYAKIEDKYKDIPLGFYVYPKDESLVPLAYGKTKRMFEIFEQVTKIPYPFNKYDQTVVGKFQFGGMENVTATTMADTEIAAARVDSLRPLVEDLVSHELAHSWFGNMVTCRNWAELWLNEGFASYLEAVFREREYGRENYIEKIRTDADFFLITELGGVQPIGLYNRKAATSKDLFSMPTVTYNKGSAVLHTLREEVGDEVFWKAVNAYLTKHRFGSVETKDLKAAMETAAERDLGWFFDQWVYGTGAPHLTVSHSWRANKLTLKIVQTHKVTGLVPAAFRLPIEVEFNAGNKKVRRKIDITKRDQTFVIETAERPTHIVIDPDLKIPLKTVKIVPAGGSRKAPAKRRS